MKWLYLREWNRLYIFEKNFHPILLKMAFLLVVMYLNLILTTARMLNLILTLSNVLGSFNLLFMQFQSSIMIVLAEGCIPNRNTVIDLGCFVEAGSVNDKIGIN